MQLAYSTTAPRPCSLTCRVMGFTGSKDADIPHAGGRGEVAPKDCPLVHEAIGPSVHRAISPSGHQVIGPSVHQTIGPSDRRSISSLHLFLFSLLVSVDGGWSAWQAWSACSVTCMGIGVRGRIRDCDNPVPLHGGSNCSGSFGETETCDNSFVLCSREQLAVS